ncbi:tail assembly chaperone [Mycobacterium phage Thonko]|uniref:Tail assembly chaperone n=1 Tax=Mycobacterium phage Thonko TaxID=2282910 RepID=A0A346FC72_9CAUD|nr:tail assembly chaperone [Mycobacterium phage Thonko]AXN53297.1 tail assembly chaperone [Mycobacterium phage Thonko]
MTTFNAEGKIKGDDQLTPPPLPDDHAQNAPQTEAEREAERKAAQEALAPHRQAETTSAGVEGGPDGQLAAARAETTEREADYQAAQSRVDAGIEPKPGDDEKIANRPGEAEVPKVSNELATAVQNEVALAAEAWPHDFIDFKGDHLGVRLPKPQALAAFTLSSGKYIPNETKNDLTSLFMAKHLSPESYGRVMFRMMDPDDPDYDVDTVGELFGAIVTASVEADKARDEAAKSKGTSADAD